MALGRCPGCGQELPDIDGAKHAYVGASSACWTRFADLGAALPPGGTPLRRLVTDAYMVQHPGIPERRAIQSVGLHLVALYLVIERGLPPDDLSATLQRTLARPPAWHWLEPPVPNGTSTVVDLEAAIASGGTADAIETYVRGVWDSWAPHRATVAQWARVAGVG
jgi:hypothetical protein